MTEATTWQASAKLETLQQRANFYDQIRAFFKARGVLAVDTPLLAPHTVTDPYIHSFAVPTTQGEWYLQTSPEFAMKRLLATHSHPIYQLGKVFRQEESGHQHNPEFTMLEWYRPHWTMTQLIEEVGALLIDCLACPPLVTLSYAACFAKWVGMDPHSATADDCLQAMIQHQVPIPDGGLNRNDYLHLLMGHCIEPQLSRDHPVAIVDYPASQAALAEVSDDEPPVAKRFEIYVQGVECANGYQELRDPTIQAQRMQDDNKLRKKLGWPVMSIDQNLLDALPHCPPCAGVAMGVDRLFMIKHGYTHIRDTLPTQHP